MNKSNSNKYTKDILLMCINQCKQEPWNKNNGNIYLKISCIKDRPTMFMYRYLSINIWKKSLWWFKRRFNIIQRSKIIVRI